MTERSTRRSAGTVVPTGSVCTCESAAGGRKGNGRKNNAAANPDRNGRSDSDTTATNGSCRSNLDRARTRARREQADFLANLSHDLRSPLTSLREFVSIVEEGLAGPISDQQREYLGIALRNADAIAEMMEHLLVLTRMQQESFRLDRRRVNLAELFQDDTLPHEDRPKEKDVSFNVNVDPGLPDAYADPDRLLEAVRNLVDNAIKYSGDAVTITIEAAETRGSMLEIRVRDTGHGMDADTRRNLFVRSYRGSQAGRKMLGGLGLGLSIVKEIVDLHGGRIRVRSQINEGTEFRLTLPQFDAKRILTESLDEMWQAADERGGGFAFVHAGIKESQGALSPSTEEAVSLVRQVLRKTLGPDDILLPEDDAGGAVRFVLMVGKSSVTATVRRLLRTVEERLKMQSGTYVEWESGPTWLHSENFNHLKEMADVIFHQWCCAREGKDAA